MTSLVTLMLREEFRMHTYYTSKYMFLSFPAIVGLFSFGVAATSDRILASTPLAQIMLTTHASIFVYGLSVGAFGFMGRMYVERQHGRRSYLVASPLLLPIRFKKTFLGLYLRDLIFYVLLLLLPATLGVTASVPITHFHLTSILFLFLASFLSFSIGISLSFFVSTLYIRSIPVFVATVITIVLLFIGQGAFNLYPLGVLLPGYMAQSSLPPLSAVVHMNLLIGTLEGVALVLLLLLGSYLLVSESFESSKTTFKEESLPRTYRRLAFLKNYRTLLSKELVDLRRSGTVTKMFFSFVTPLLFLSFITWFVRVGLAVPVGFNTVFYGAMVGFFGVILYSWLNNVDVMDYFETLPVSPPQVIRTKLITFLILTSWISTIFLFGISWLNDDTSLLWLALPVMLIVSVYMVVMTAYLTGLRTNTFLFDATVLAKFSVMSMLPDVCLVILSFTIDKNFLFSMIGILSISIVLIFTTYILYRGIGEKWKDADFSG